MITRQQPFSFGRLFAVSAAVLVLSIAGITDGGDARFLLPMAALLIYTAGRRVDWHQ